MVFYLRSAARALREGAMLSAAASEPQRKRRTGFDRPPFLWVCSTALYLFAPTSPWSWINLVQLVEVAAGVRRPQLPWYRAFWDDPDIKNSLVAKFELRRSRWSSRRSSARCSHSDSVRARGRLGGSANILMLLPLITPEIVTAVGVPLFGRAGMALSLQTIILGHITFSISYVTVIVRARLSRLNREVEEAAMISERPSWEPCASSPCLRCIPRSPPRRCSSSCCRSTTS